VQSSSQITTIDKPEPFNSVWKWQCFRTKSSLFLSVLMAIFPGEPGLASFVVAKGDGGGGDNWSYKTCKAPVTSSPPTNQHPTFYRPDALPVAQPTVSKH